MRNVEGKIVIFKTIAILYFSIIHNNCPKTYYKLTYYKLTNTEGFSVEILYSKIKHETLCNDYKTGNVDIPKKL